MERLWKYRSFASYRRRFGLYPGTIAPGISRTHAPRAGCHERRGWRGGCPHLPPDVVVLDLATTIGPGLDVFQQIRSINASIPVVFLTNANGGDAAIELAADFSPHGKLFTTSSTSCTFGVWLTLLATGHREIGTRARRAPKNALESKRARRTASYFGTLIAFNPPRSVLRNHYL